MGMGIWQPRSPPSCPADPQVTGQGAAHPILLHPACHPHPLLRAVPGEVRSPKRGSFVFYMWFKKRLFCTLVWYQRARKEGAFHA